MKVPEKTNEGVGEGPLNRRAILNIYGRRALSE
jgi:hypothetical protein